MRRLVCKTFGHYRKSHGARRCGTGWRSICKHCGKPLFRISHGDWRIIPVLDPTIDDQLVMTALIDRSPRRLPFAEQ